MLKITLHNFQVPAILLDTDNAELAHFIMAQLGFHTDSYTLESFEHYKLPTKDSLSERTVRIKETSQDESQINVEFLDNGDVIGVDWFTQRDCVILFRTITNWVADNTTHGELTDLITKRILRR